MAVKLLTATGTFTAGTWRRAEAFVVPTTAAENAVGAGDDVFTERTQAVTFANAGNQVGLVLWAGTVGATWGGNITIKLQEQTAPSVWTDRTTDVFAFSQANYPAYISGVFYFPLTTYAVTTVAATWRYSIKQDTTGKTQLRKKGTSYLHAAILDADTTKPGSGDCAIVAQDATLQISESWTAGTAGTNPAVILCYNATLGWENPPASAYTLTVNSGICFCIRGWIKVGTSVLAIPLAQKATVDLTGMGTTNPFWVMSYYSTYGNAVGWEFFGQQRTDLQARVAAQASSGQKVFTTTVDMSGTWTNGDKVRLYGTSGASSELAEYTIDTVVGTTVTLTGNMTYTLYAGAAVLNKMAGQKLGIQITGANVRLGADDASIDHLHYSGVYLYRVGIRNQLGMVLVPARPVWIENVMQYNNGDANCQFVFSGLPNAPLPGIYVNGLYIYRLTYSSALSTFGTAAYPLVTSTFSNFTDMAGYSDTATQAGLYLSAINTTITNVVMANGYASQWGGCKTALLEGAALTCSGFWLHTGRELLKLNVKASTFDSVKIGGGSAGEALYLQDAVGCGFTNCDFGYTLADTSYDIACVSNYLQQCIFTNCKIGAGGIGNYANSVPGSYLRWDTYNATANDHRGYEPYGRHVSTGAGLTDINVRTAGGFALRFEPTSSANNLAWSFTVPTGSIATKTMYLSVWCKINAAAFYAGTHEKPRLTVRYDNSTDAYAEAAATTDWQLLTVAFTPATSYGQITVTLSCRTDAVGADAYVYWDDMGVSFPPNVALDLGALDLWANALPVTPPLAIPLSAQTVAQSVWQQLRAGLGAAGTFGAVDEWAGAIDAATIRAAIGMAAANLDTQIGDLPTNAELTAALAGADDAVLAAIAALNDLDAVGAQAAASAALAAYDAATDGDVGAAVTTLLAAIGSGGLTADEVLDEDVEGTITLRQAMRVLLAFVAGKASGGGTTAIAYRDQADTKDRLALVVDAQGNRTASTLDVT